MLSRAFFLPGDLPAMTRLGCTLFRHCFCSALRYGRYHLGLSVPAAPQVCLVHLRPYFEGDPRDTFDDLILDPGGESAPDLSLRTVAALTFHRLRLALPRRLLKPRPATEENIESDPWDRFRSRVSVGVPVLGDALLADLAAVRRRRRERSSHGAIPPCSSPRASILAAQGSLPSADVGVPSVSLTKPHEPLPTADRNRGAFRDAWVIAADDLRPLVVALGERARRRGLVREAEDVFFLPFDHLDVLAGEKAPQWLASAVDANREEWPALARSEAPPERLEEGTAGLRWRRSDQDHSIPAAIAPLA